jgi:hypothetical protein
MTVLIGHLCITLLAFPITPRYVTRYISVLGLVVNMLRGLIKVIVRSIVLLSGIESSIRNACHICTLIVILTSEIRGAAYLIIG